MRRAIIAGALAASLIGASRRPAGRVERVALLRRRRRRARSTRRSIRSTATTSASCSDRVALELARTTRSRRRTRAAAGRVRGHAAHGQRRALHLHRRSACFAAIDPGTGKTHLADTTRKRWKAGRPTNLGFLHRGLGVLDRRHRPSVCSPARTTRTSSRSTRRPASPTRRFGDRRPGRSDRAPRRSSSASGTTRSPRRRSSSATSSSSARASPTARRTRRRRAATSAASTSAPASGCGRSTRCRSRASSATTRGKNDSAEYTGNTNVWSLMSVDEELGYVYLPFGTPTNDYYGGHRLGNNLFAESLVCLDATTGKRVWHFQARAPRPVGLRLPRRADPRRHHGRRPARSRPSLQVSKQGFVYVFDRRTGTAGLADRGAAGAAVDGARREDVADAAVPDQAAGVRSAGVHRRRRDRLHAGAARRRRSTIVKPYDRGPLFTPPTARGQRFSCPATAAARTGAARRSIRRPGCCTCRRSRTRSSSRSPQPPTPTREQPALPPQRAGGAADARRAAALEAAVQPRHRVRLNTGHDRLAGAARRRPARPPAARGSEPAAARRRPRLSAAHPHAAVRGAPRRPAGGPQGDARTAVLQALDKATGRRSRRSSCRSDRRRR